MAPQKTISRASWIGLFSMGLLWGCSFLATNVMLRQLPVETVVALRVLLGAVGLWGFVILARLPVSRAPRLWIAFLLIGGVNVALPFFLIAWGQQYISTGLTGILNAATALFGPLVAAIMFADERLGARKATGVFLGFMGVSTILGLEALRDFDLRSAGQLALIGASFCYGFGAAMARKFLTGVPSEVSAAGMISGACVWMIPIALMKHGMPDFTALPLETYAAWGYSALLATTLAYLLLFRVIKNAGSGNATLVTLLVAPVSVVVGALVLNETLALNAYLGFALIALGLLILDGRVLNWLRRAGNAAP